MTRVLRPRALVLALATALAVAAVVCCVDAMPTDRFGRFDRFDAVAAADDTAVASDGDAAAFGVFSEVEADVEADIEADVDADAGVEADADANVSGALGARVEEVSAHSAANHAGFGGWVKLAWPQPKSNRQQTNVPGVLIRPCADAGVPDLPGLYEWATTPHKTKKSPDGLAFVVRYAGKADGRHGLLQRCSAYMADGKSFGGHLNAHFVKAIVDERQDLWYRWRAEPSWPPSEADYQEMKLIHDYRDATPVNRNGKPFAATRSKADVARNTVGFVGTPKNGRAVDPVFEWNTQGTGDASYFAQLERRHKHFARHRQQLLDQYKVFAGVAVVMLQDKRNAGRDDVLKNLAAELRCRPDEVVGKLVAWSTVAPPSYDPNASSDESSDASSEASSDASSASDDETKTKTPSTKPKSKALSLSGSDHSGDESEHSSSSSDVESAEEEAAKLTMTPVKKLRARPGTVDPRIAVQVTPKKQTQPKDGKKETITITIKTPAFDSSSDASGEDSSESSSESSGDEKPKQKTTLTKAKGKAEPEVDPKGKDKEPKAGSKATSKSTSKATSKAEPKKKADEPPTITTTKKTAAAATATTKKVVGKKQ